MQYAASKKRKTIKDAKQTICIFYRFSFLLKQFVCFNKRTNACLRVGQCRAAETGSERYAMQWFYVVNQAGGLPQHNTGVQRLT